MKKQIFALLSSIFLIAINNANAENNISVLSKNSGGLIFQITNDIPQLDTVSVAGKQFLNVNFTRQTGVYNYADQAFPEITTILAIPPTESTVQISLLNANWQPCGTNLALNNAPKSMPPAEKISIVSLAGSGWVRDTRIAQIRMIPLQFNNDQWYYLASAEIQVQWPVYNAPPTLLNQIQNDSSTLNVLNKSDIAQFRKQHKRPFIAKKFQQTGLEFIRLEVEDNGLYRISGAMLTQAGLSISSIDPAQLRMYSGGGRALPERVTDPRAGALTEIPIILMDNQDGRFDNTDAIIFFGQSVNDWEYLPSQDNWAHYTNPYETKNVYWISWDTKSNPALRHQAETASGSVSPVEHALQLHAIENEFNKIFHSGRNWYGNPLSAGDSENFTFLFKNPRRSSAQIRLRVTSDNRGNPNTLGLRLNNGTERIFSFNSPGLNDEAYINIGSIIPYYDQFETETPGNNTLQIQYKSTTGNAKTYVDWIELIVDDSLQAQNGELSFATRSSNEMRSFSMVDFSSEPVVLEISNPTAPRQLSVQQQGSAWQFTDALIDTTGRRYFAATQLKEPTNLAKYTFSSLRDSGNRADMIIVVPEIFKAAGNRLAEHKRSFRGMEVEVVDINKIINEFGWGLNDPTALRDFIAYAYHNWQIPPRYIVLLGDGTYDYKNISSAGADNHLITFQTTESAELSNRNIEAYYVYVSGDDRLMDLAIGRMPVQTVAEADLFVDKIIQYEANPQFGVWRNKVTMVADDEYVSNGTATQVDQRLHTPQAEGLMQNDIPDYLIQQKIYLMNYRAIRNSAVLGIRKPDAQNALINAINSGSLIINYVGHGNPTVWAHERIFVQNEDIAKIENGAKQAFYIAATCDFGRFDDPRRQSFTEDLLHMDNGGAISFLTSSRVVFSTSNAQINSQFFKQLFADGQNLQTVGDALMNARLYTNNITNDEKYTIIGDPSLILAVPTSIARIGAVNPDTLLSLSTTSVTGDLFLGTGERITTPGQVDVLVYDDDRAVNYISNMNITTSYTMPGNIMFRGRGSVENGKFDLNFIVPKDITYGGNNASINVYGTGENWEAAGSVANLPISLKSAVLLDNEGPEIDINFSGRETFSNGDPVPANAMLSATLRDEISGINVTSEIGHKITLTIDGDTENLYDLTQDFIYFENDYLAGKVVTQLPELEVGFHAAELKVWDNSNNSSKLTFDFQITEAGELVLREVLNYPNPFRENTTFTFLLNNDAEIDVSIYTVSGRKIRKLEGITGIPGYNEIFWDGRDAEGDQLANGIYLYRIQAKAEIDNKTQKTEFIGKAALNY
ncbi:MAG: T9SS C-terminal target domain-containing protein [Calditrichaeota bacterium]|nr:MAG: T9SS C-terminal target domain-containing protein [Calditrichota bacterium]